MIQHVRLHSPEELPIAIDLHQFIGQVVRASNQVDVINIAAATGLMGSKDVNIKRPSSVLRLVVITSSKAESININIGTEIWSIGYS